MARDGNRWLLRVEHESLRQSNSGDRLGQALGSLGHQVQLVIEIGTVRDTAAMRLAAEAARRQAQAEEHIRADPFVQAMMRDFGGKIVPGTLKATS